MIKLQQRPEAQLLPFSTIEAAKRGNADALSAVLKHFERYIVTLSTRELRDEYGSTYRCLDPDLKRRLEAKLIVSIIQKFTIA